MLQDHTLQQVSKIIGHKDSSSTFLYDRQKITQEVHQNVVNTVNALRKPSVTVRDKPTSLTKAQKEALQAQRKQDISRVINALKEHASFIQLEREPVSKLATPDLVTLTQTSTKQKLMLASQQNPLKKEVDLEKKYT